MKAEDITPILLLDTAIARLERLGWTQDGAGSLAGSNCLSSAIGYAEVELLGEESWKIADSKAEKIARRAVEKMLAEHFQYGPDLGFGVWNDDPERTYEDLMIVLKQARTDLESADKLEVTE